MASSGFAVRWLRPGDRLVLGCLCGTVTAFARDDLIELLAVLRPGDTVIVAKLDCAFRNAADALATAEAWKRRGVDLIVADMGTEPVTQNGVSRMFFGMLALVAEFERERIKERSAEGRAAKRRAGGHIGGDAPFGWRRVGAGRAARLERDPEQQAALATIRKLAAEGLSSRAIAAAVKDRTALPCRMSRSWAR